MFNRRETQHTLGEKGILGDEAVAELLGTIEQLRTEVGELRDRVDSQFTTIAAHAEHWFEGDPTNGWIITLLDVWCLADHPHLSDYQIAAWVPVDHLPAPPDVLRFFHNSGALPVAMSRFGEQMLMQAGLDPTYVPLTVDTSVYRPTFELSIDDTTITGRELFKIPTDAFVVGMVGRTESVLHEVAELMPRRGMVTLISDLYFDSEDLLSALNHFRHFGHDVLVFHVLEPVERNLNVDGSVRFRDLETGEEIITQAHEIRASFTAAVEAWIEELHQGCLTRDLDHHVLLTSTPLEQALWDYFIRRAQLF